MDTGNDLQMEQFRQSLYDGVNEQVLCTLGLLKTVNGEKFRTVSYFLSLLHIGLGTILQKKFVPVGHETTR